MKYCYNCGYRLEKGEAFCVHCGKEVDKLPLDGQSRYCTRCGNPLSREFDEYCRYCYGKVNYIPLKRNNAVKDSLSAAAKVLLTLSCALAGLCGVVCIVIGAILTFGMRSAAEASSMAGLALLLCGMFALISLTWRLPLTAHVFDHIKRGRRIGTAVKVCILLFVGLVSGILLLCRTEANYR